MTDNIFTSDGRIDTSIDPATVPEKRRAQYVALRDAQIKCERTESAQAAADKRVAEVVREHDVALANLPRRTFLEEWRASRG